MARTTSRVSRVVVRGPLGPFADAYREKLEERGYLRLSAVNFQRQVAQMSRWLDGEGLGVEQLEAHIEVFLVTHRASGRGRSVLSRPGLLCLLELLRELGVVTAPVRPPLSPTEALMESFRLRSGKAALSGKAAYPTAKPMPRARSRERRPSLWTGCLHVPSGTLLPPLASGYPPGNPGPPHPYPRQATRRAARQPTGAKYPLGALWIGTGTAPSLATSSISPRSP